MKNKGGVYDAIVVGGGPAGLSCALVLGRCRRKVLVFDTGKQRNRVSSAMHAFPSRDGEHPLVFLNKIKKELSAYGIKLQKREIVRAVCRKDLFEVESSEGDVFYAKKLLLATGVRDVLPPLPNVEKYFGKGVYHCPYCDGWEHRDKPWVLCCATRKAAIENCLSMKTWSGDITLLAHYTKGLTAADLALLTRNGIKVLRAPAKFLNGKAGRLNAVVMEDGHTIPCEAFFFSSPPRQHSDLALQLGCRRTPKGKVDFNRLQQTNIKGLYVAGDMAKDMQLVLIAAAEGAKAGVVINTELNKESRRE